MIIVPAIDMIDGQCVRLMKGRYDQQTTYSDDPLAMAMEFQKAGAKRIHLVDLDAAKNPAKHNRTIIEKIARETEMVVEVGGGIRTAEDVEQLLDIGVDKLVVGTILAKSPETVKSWAQKYGSCFVAGIDAQNGEVKISGWEAGSGLKDEDLASQVKALGCTSIIYTNIDKDGTLEGPDVASCERIHRVSGLPVIVSGGISSLQDFGIAWNRPGIVGTITGRALYEGRFTLGDAIQKYQAPTEEAAIW